MPELRIPIDPCNPGQFYACCGLVELFDLSGRQTLSRFEVDWRRPRAAEFVLTSDKELDFNFIAQSVRDAKFSPLPRVSADKPPEKDAIAPVAVSIFGKETKLDWWLDDFHDRATSLKCWAGQVTTQKLVAELPRLLPAHDATLACDGYTSTRFGIDPRSAWVALNLGYSPNEQEQKSRTFPAVELLAAFGLQGFRPAGDRSSGFRYALWLTPLPLLVARTSAAQPWNGLPARKYEFQLGERGSSKFFCFATQLLS